MTGPAYSPRDTTVVCLLAAPRDRGIRNGMRFFLARAYAA